MTTFLSPDALTILTDHAGPTFCDAVVGITNWLQISNIRTQATRETKAYAHAWHCTKEQSMLHMQNHKQFCKFTTMAMRLLIGTGNKQRKAAVCSRTSSKSVPLCSGIVKYFESALRTYFSAFLNLAQSDGAVSQWRPGGTAGHTRCR
jgi:hypothetical protein